MINKIASSMEIVEHNGREYVKNVLFSKMLYFNAGV